MTIMHMPRLPQVTVYSGSSYNIPSTKMGMTISEQPRIPPGTLVNVPQIQDHNSNIYLADRVGNQYFWDTVNRAPIGTKSFEKPEIENGIVIHQTTGCSWTIVLSKGNFYATQTVNLEIKAVP